MKPIAVLLSATCLSAAAVSSQAPSGLSPKLEGPVICDGKNLTGQCEDLPTLDSSYCYTLPAFYLGRPGLSSFRGKKGTSCMFWDHEHPGCKEEERLDVGPTNGSTSVLDLTAYYVWNFACYECDTCP
ncbi:hypothetical protein PG990_003668 [Apiospora arundinis]